MRTPEPECRNVNSGEDRAAAGDQRSITVGASCREKAPEIWVHSRLED